MMRRGLWGLTIMATLLAITSAAGILAQTRTRPGAQKSTVAQKPTPSDLKIKYKSTIGGQVMESTTMIKGPRERSETMIGAGMDMVSITQCDLKRTIQINDRVRKYVITPMETETSSANQTAPSNVATPAQETRRGGVVTYTTTATDTGERKEMYGFTARRVKTSLKMESSPDACNPVNQRIETDGWYIDFSVNFNCDLDRARVAAQPAPRSGGCRDRVVFKRQGTARTGYPLSETTTMYGPDGAVTFTSNKEVVELSRDPLDAALFDIPTGYAEARDTSEFYAMPSMDTIMSQANQGQQPAPNTTVSPASGAKQPGTLRVGVVTINNSAGKPVSTDALRARLVGNIEATGVEAIPLNAISATEAEVEAKAKQCDFILYTDIRALKSSAAKKLGGVFGRVAGVGGIDTTEAKVDFKLFAVGESSPRLQSSAIAKEQGDEASVGTAIDTEAQQVSLALRKKN